MRGLFSVDKNDYEELTRVWESSVRATHFFLEEADIAFFRPLILNEYLSAVTLRCKKNEIGEIVGFIGVLEDNIEMLFVVPSAIGQGFGKELTMYGIEVLGAKKVDVNEQNPNAVAFYQKLGFTIVGRSPTDGMGKPFPLLHMVLHT